MKDQRELDAYLAAYTDDDDNVRGDYPAAIKTIIRAVRDVASTEAEVDRLRAECADRESERADLRDRVTKAEAIASWAEALFGDPRLYLAPDAYGEPTIWHYDDGAPQPVIVKSALTVGQRWLWDVVVARLTGGAS